MFNSEQTGLLPLKYLSDRHELLYEFLRLVVQGSAVAWLLEMHSKQNLTQEDTYFRVMHILKDNPDLTQRELAERLGVSVGSLNYCLKALIEKGWIKMQNFGQSKNKFGYVYILTPRGIAEKAALTGNFLKRKRQEYEALKAEIESLSSELEGKPEESKA